MLPKTERTESQPLSLVFTGHSGEHQLVPVGGSCLVTVHGLMAGVGCRAGLGSRSVE